MIHCTIRLFCWCSRERTLQTWPVTLAALSEGGLVIPLIESRPELRGELTEEERIPKDVALTIVASHRYSSAGASVHSRAKALAIR